VAEVSMTGDAAVSAGLVRTGSASGGSEGWAGGAADAAGADGAQQLSAEPVGMEVSLACDDAAPTDAAGKRPGAGDVVDSARPGSTEAESTIDDAGAGGRLGEVVAGWDGTVYSPGVGGVAVSATSSVTMDSTRAGGAGDLSASGGAVGSARPVTEAASATGGGKVDSAGAGSEAVSAVSGSSGE
jgi:hypothetical protein